MYIDAGSGNSPTSLTFITTGNFERAFKMKITQIEAGYQHIKKHEMQSIFTLLSSPEILSVTVEMCSAGRRTEQWRAACSTTQE